jgi:hypothetical protein
MIIKNRGSILSPTVTKVYKTGLWLISRKTVENIKKQLVFNLKLKFQILLTETGYLEVFLLKFK